MPDYPDQRREQEGEEDAVGFDPGDEIYKMLHNSNEYTPGMAVGSVIVATLLIV